MAEPAFCDGGNGLGCGGHFPQKTDTGLCGKCYKLSSLDESSPEYGTFQKYGQCLGCGLAWKHLSGMYCGRCANSAGHSAGHQAASSVSDTAEPQASQPLGDLAKAAVEASRAARANAMGARLNKQPTFKVPSAPIHTASGIAAAKASLREVDQTVLIKVVCRIKGCESKKENASTESGYGHWGRPWPREAYLSEVLQHSLKTLNTDWSRNHGIDLVLEEVELRMCDNNKLIDGTASGTVGQVYDYHMTGDMAVIYDVQKKRKKATLRDPKQMDMEIFIDKAKFLKRLVTVKENARTASHAAPGTAIATRKRSASATTELHVTKRLASGTTVGLDSSFVRTSAPACTGMQGGGVSFVKIKLLRAHATCDAVTGEVDIMWLDDLSSKPEDGLIATSVLAEGATKKVYQLSIGSSLFVAKRFYEIGNPDPVSAEENTMQLQNELIRLKLSAWFLAKFKSYAKEQGVEISEDVVVSEGFLMREQGAASPSSDLPPPNHDAAVWLVEPRRTKTVYKYSGTLVFPNRKDKLGMTLHAFSHFVYEYSDKKLVLADIQGSPMNIRGQETIVLFDLMTHTSTGDSGVGDFGIAGINTFLRQHKCNLSCLSLKLSSINVANGDGEDISEDADINHSAQQATSSTEEDK